MRRYCPCGPTDPQQKPFKANVRTTYTDFFPMFDVPFKYGRPWSAADDENRSAVVVLTSDMNDRLFGGRNSVGKISSPGQRALYRDAACWMTGRSCRVFTICRFSPFGRSDEVFMPFTRAIDKQMKVLGSIKCNGDGRNGYEVLLRSECVWLQFWVELPTAADAAEVPRIF